MVQDSRIYVFDCGCPEYLGFSIEKDGSNLPACLIPLHKWTRVKEIPFDPDAISSLFVEPAIAIENLKTRGYHLAKQSADNLSFPQGVKETY